MRRARDLDRAAGLQGVRDALSTRVTPALRAVAVKVDKPVVWTRFLYDGEPTDLERALADATGEAAGAHLSGRWLSQVLLRSAPPGTALVLEPGEEWAYTRDDALTDTPADTEAPGSAV